MHKQGYTFLNVNKLTNSEISALVSAFNREQKNIEREHKKARNKAKHR